MPECPAVNGRERKPRQKPSLNVERLLWAKNAGEDLRNEKHRDAGSHVVTGPCTDVIYMASVLHIFEIGYITPFMMVS